MFDLFTVYPELCAHIDGLCGGAPWGLAGVSALVYDESDLYFELTKPRHWTTRPDGSTLAYLGGIGGRMELGETVLGCLYREVDEELGASVEVESAARTFFVYEQHRTAPIELEQRDHPVPVLFTVSANVQRREELPQYQVLVIATFSARLLEPATLGDLYGLVSIPQAALPAALAPEETTLQRLGALGARWTAREALPADLHLATLWTARSVQLLVQAGCA